MLQIHFLTLRTILCAISNKIFLNYFEFVISLMIYNEHNCSNLMRGTRRLLIHRIAAENVLLVVLPCNRNPIVRTFPNFTHTLNANVASFNVVVLLLATLWTTIGMRTRQSWTNVKQNLRYNVFSSLTPRPTITLCRRTDSGLHSFNFSSWRAVTGRHKTYHLPHAKLPVQLH